MFNAFETSRSHRHPASGRPAPATGPESDTHEWHRAGGEDTGEPYTDPGQGPLAGLPVELPGAHGPHPLHGCYALPSAMELASVNLYDPTHFRRGLSDWLAGNDRTRSGQAATEARAAATAELSDSNAVRQVSDDIRSALCAAASIGMAHSAEMLMAAMSSHPLIRLSAVSHPFVLGTLIENLLKKIAEVPDPDPLTRIAPRYEEKIVAALLNWNYVQPLLDTVLKSPLARSLKVVATAGIGGVRDLAERNVVRRKLAALPEDAPEGGRKLTVMESMFVICLLCALRNVAVDLPRQVVRSQASGALPAAEGVTERLLRHTLLGSQVPGGLPSACIVSQAALVEVVRDENRQAVEEGPGLRMGDQANNPF